MGGRCYTLAAGGDGGRLPECIRNGALVLGSARRRDMEVEEATESSMEASRRRGRTGSPEMAGSVHPELGLARGEAKEEEELSANTKARSMARCRGRRGARHGGVRRC